jgi:hypothetical protein
MAINNPQLYNAAVAGACAGAKVSRWISNPSAASYQNDRDAAVAFAAAVDAAIPLDPTLNENDAQLMFGITSAILQNKAIVSTLNSSTVALAIAGLYNEIAPVLAPYGWPGSPSYYVENFGAKGDFVTDDTAAINRAIAAAIAVPGNVYLMSRHRVTAALTPLSNNNIGLIGRGEFNGGTILSIDPPGALPSRVITILGAQYCSIQNIWCVANRAQKTEFFIGLSGAYRPYVSNVQISGYGNGFDIDSCVGAHLLDCQVNDTFGSYCYYAHGTNPFFCHDTYFERCGGGTSYLMNVTSAPGAWATGTIYAAGATVLANGGIWQCSVGGTSAGAGTGPGSAGLPSTNPAMVHTTAVVDNTCQWLFAMGQFNGFVHGSFAHTVTLMKCGMLQGDIGLLVVDDVPAGGSVPTFTHSWQFSSDHPYSRGVKLGGLASWHDQVLATSIQAGDGIEVTTAAGNVEINSGQIFGCARKGLTYAGTGGLILQNLDIGPCSSVTANTFDGIEIANNSQNFKIRNCTSGDVPGFATSARYGVSIGTGCDNYVVEGNKLVGNDTGPILDNTGGSTSRIVRHNIPEAAFYDAQNGVSKQSLAAGTQTLTVPADCHTVIISPTGAVVIDQIIHQSVPAGTNSGVRLKIIKEQSAATGTVAFRDNNTSLNSVWTPNSVDWVLSRFNDAVELFQGLTTQLASVRWHIIGRATPIATVSIVVPAVAAGQVGYVDTNISATALGGITTADAVLVNPTSDLVAAGAGGGFLNARISATNTLRAAFVGPLAGGAANFLVTKVSYVG